jgi:exopolysaccharide biosynthesis protein
MSSQLQKIQGHGSEFWTNERATSSEDTLRYYEVTAEDTVDVQRASPAFSTATTMSPEVMIIGDEADPAYQTEDHMVSRYNARLGPLRLALV